MTSTILAHICSVHSRSSRLIRSNMIICMYTIYIHFLLQHTIAFVVYICTYNNSLLYILLGTIFMYPTSTLWQLHIYAGKWPPKSHMADEFRQKWLFDVSTSTLTQKYNYSVRLSAIHYVHIGAMQLDYICILILIYNI